MKLLIAIPALNEENSIDSIIRRSLAARSFIVEHSPVSDVEITVISDGSTDRTAELAAQYLDHINLIVFKNNKGYGAAIKEAWKRSGAELLSFLDADGTCDPRFFADLCKAMEQHGADVVLGCRLNADSKMPMIRRLGNVMFARLLSIFSSAVVRDTASGMRVVKRSVLNDIFPLPDGLHFTPAMSARAMLSGNVRIVEIDMPYSEREGQSKLRVVRDGLRFFEVILKTAFLYRPSRLLGMAAIVCLIIAAGLMLMPAVYYIHHRSILEWMIYRFVVSDLFGSTAILLFAAGYLTSKMVRLALPARGKVELDWAGRLFASAWFWSVPVLLMVAGGALVVPSLIDLVRTGATYEHWSRFIAMSFLYTIAATLIVTRAVDYILELLASQLDYIKAGSAAAHDGEWSSSDMFAPALRADSRG